MVRLTANLGFLWSDRPLTEAIVLARAAGFAGVECHWPYDTEPSEVRRVLEETGMEMLSINTRQGINGPDDFGVNALPGREAEARGYLDEAIAYATEAGVRNINAAAGKSGGTAEAEAVYRENLRYASAKAAAHGISILVESVNQRDAPGYHVSSIEDAVATVRAVGASNVKVLFDFYHVQTSQGDVLNRFRQSLPFIGHIQFAGTPGRNEPDTGEIAYRRIFEAIDEAGWEGYVGAEYRPLTTTDAGLEWIRRYGVVSEMGEASR